MNTFSPWCEHAARGSGASYSRVLQVLALEFDAKVIVS